MAKMIMWTYLKVKYVHMLPVMLMSKLRFFLLFIVIWVDEFNDGDWQMTNSDCLQE